jgi:hypothetical protein
MRWRPVATLVLGIALALGPNVPRASAIDDPDLFRGRTLVTGQRPETRNPGYVACLRDVLVKVSGDPSVLQAPGIPALEARAGDLVIHHAYRDRMAGIPVHDEQGSRDRPYVMTVSFDPVLIEEELENLGSWAWTEPRPTIALALTIDGGGGPYPLTAAGPGEGHREAIAEAAWTRGLTVALPAAPGAPVEGKPLVGQARWDAGALVWRGQWHFRDETWEGQAESFDRLYRDVLAVAMALSRP